MTSITRPEGGGGRSAGTDPGKVVKGLLEQLPGLKDVLGAQKPGSA